MHITALRRACGPLALLFGVVGMSPAAAEDAFPPRQVRIIVPMAGGMTDVLGRVVAPKLAEALSTTVIVETKAGAGGNIATDLVAKGPSDGSLLLISVNAPLVVNGSLMKSLPYDPLRDLAPVTLAMGAAQLLAVHPSLPVRTVEEFVAYVKANPGLPYASVGVGSASHLTMEMFRSAAGLEMSHVPYRGAAPALVDLIGGNVKVAFLQPGNALPYLAKGDLRVLASSGRTRMAGAPLVPTLIESGFRDFESIGWIGFHVRAGTPPAVVDRYNAELVRILLLPEVKARFTEAQFEVHPGTPAAFNTFLREETIRWAKVIKQNGITAE